MKLNVSYCIGKNYFQHLLVSINSLIESNVNLKIWVLHDGLDVNELTILHNLAGQDICEIESILIEDRIFNNLVKGHHFTNANYYRLLIPDLLPSHVKQVLYLDADLVVVSNLDEVFKTDISSHFLAAVEGARFDRHLQLRMSRHSHYFCSGVMLINTELWKEFKLKEKVIEFTNKNPEHIKFVDQCGLNAIIDGRWLPLHPRYDQQTAFWGHHVDCNTFGLEELEEAKTNPAIIHYTGSSKPWHFMNNHPYKSEYWKYLKMTPYADYKPTDYTLKNVILKNTPEWLKVTAKKILGR